MIDSQSIKKKATRIWDQGKILRAWILQENIFPLDIAFSKKYGRHLSENFTILRNQLQELHRASKQVKEYGYRIEYKSVDHRQLGQQQLPDRIIFETLKDFLQFIRKEKTMQLFQNLFHHTMRSLPQLRGLLARKPFLLLQYQNTWPKLLQVCQYFLDHPKPEIYIRQISIAGIDTKLIEKNQSILHKLFMEILPETHYHKQVEQLSRHGFEQRYGLLFEQPLVRFRFLDKERNNLGLSDIALPLNEFAALDAFFDKHNFKIEKIFITENKINGLSFPQYENALIIFGLGYGIQILQNIEWLKHKSIFYWGDIDTHGFHILHQARVMFPRCQSMLMDEATLLAHRERWVTETESQRCLLDLDSLQPEEAQVYEKLKRNKYGSNVRLEQEMVDFEYLQKAMAFL